ncbi:hypothetical protein Syun_022323 [Stephania yunnanensis]|uniref:Major facilitator superfamily (MFS) profile domain-containing protein n=1 Tax=Stephania yunnanensis TaxID=152371 RepID=A0AAP0F9D7_9MAGN
MSNETGKGNQYCKFDSQLLTSFTSSLAIYVVAALVASSFAASITRIFGRTLSMLLGGVVFLAGSALDGAATNVEMLIIGRLLLGVGIGFANQSEMAPAKIREALNIGFQLAITIGILVANAVNYDSNRIKGGFWLESVLLALAAVPAIIMTCFGLVLTRHP